MSGNMKSKVRVVHNVANGPDVDGYLDGMKVLKNFGYKSISDYLEVKSGKHTLTVKVSSNDSVIINGDVNLMPGKAYTVIVHGLISDLNSISSLVLEDNLMCPMEGKAHVRFIHAAAGVPAVDIYAGNTKIFDNVAYGQVGNPMYLPVDAGMVDVSVTAAGSLDIALGPINLRLVGRNIYTVIASGLIGDDRSPLTALVTEDTKGSCIVMNM